MQGTSSGGAWLKLKAAGLLCSLCLAICATRALGQETQSVPGPVGPVPGSSPQPPASQAPGTQPNEAPKAAPVERHASRPVANTEGPAVGPLTKTSTAGQSGVQPVGSGRGASGGVGTLKVQTRLVNVALNVVDAHGAPVGGFEKQDFRIFEDGEPQTIAVFEREATSPLSIVLAIDSSETVLTSDRLERQAAKHFVRAILREQDELDLMDFADTVREIVPFTNQAKRVEQGLNDLEQGDETALYNAVFLASERLAQTSPAADRRRVLVVISDGGDSIHGGEKYEQAIAEAQRAGAIIYPIIIVPIAADAGRNTGGEHALIQMAQDTGGKYYYVSDPADLEPAFRHVSEDLRTQYLLGYYAPQANGDASFRRIKVTLADGAGRDGLSLRYRTGYFPDAR
ncbi:MAG TPA: VWA domain-containing protein [Acidobacteriaceae bacterium]|nr:VWA domain-containing protein [Acidobacteriaceae bacterium]